MKVSDYIVSFLIEKEITDVFGYPGGMITHLMDSFDKYKDKITAHMNYHEQASAFCACGYAQVSGKPGIAYATSGPGATNLITGIANAYFDSTPTIFITGQVNTYEMMDGLSVRQRGFQEMDIVSIVKPITKYVVQISHENNIKYELEKLFCICMEGRKGPVLIDIPMNIFRAEIEPTKLSSYIIKEKDTVIIDALKTIELQLIKSKKPVIVAGKGISIANMIPEFRQLVEQLKIPVVSSMIARDVMSSQSPYEFGFIGAYGHRYSNFIIANSDLIIELGSRLDNRQTGANRETFASKAKIIRFDIDQGELDFHIKDDEICYKVNLDVFIPSILMNFKINCDFSNWLNVCTQLKQRLSGMDDQYANTIIKTLSMKFPDGVAITTDVGQNQVWAAQSVSLKDGQKMLFSGGHGAMGYSLPASIGAYYGTRKPVISINGDGGLQMNIQELQFIVREQLPIKIVLLNNNSLGMIRHFQEMYFNSNFVQTTSDKGYKTPSFEKISKAYNIAYFKINNIEQIENTTELLTNDKPAFIEVSLPNSTYVYPKLSMGKPIHDQDILMDRNLFNELMKMCEI